MVRSYNVEHCHVVVVVHPTAGVFRPSYQLRYKGRVPQLVFRAEIARILLHSCDGDLNRECPLRDPASFARYRVKTRTLFAQVTCGVDARFEPIACALCGTGVESPPMCGRCGMSYCSPKCQKDHWPAHKADCKRIAGEIAQGFDQLAETRALFVADPSANAAADAEEVD
jgi:hypothetical protein